MVREIFKDLNLSENEYKIADEKFRRLMVRKGDFLLNEGQCVHYQYYVYSGCLRSYFLHESGKEHTIQFAMSDWWISDYTAFFTGGRSILYIECLQDAEIYKISKGSLEELYAEVPLIEYYFRLIMEKSFVSFQNRIISDLALSAKERYCWFIKRYPSIEQKIRNYHVASYLGITTESLSRIRKDLALEKGIASHLM
jgi:CRP-like cAMP-binding protein